MRRDIRSENGALILELAIVLPIFIFMIMFVYGLFVVNTAENEISHAMIQSAKSLSLDSYTNERYDSVSESKTFWSGLNSMIEDFRRLAISDPYFSSSSDWYNAGNKDVVVRRFIGFFSGGDVNAANEKLKSLGIKDGVNGLKFDVESSSSELSVTVKYTIQIWFDYWGVGKLPVQHTIKAKMW